MNTNSACASEQCTVEKCDIFDFMARHVGMTVIHPGGFAATRKLAEACHLDSKMKVVDIACGKGTSGSIWLKNTGVRWSAWTSAKT